MGLRTDTRGAAMAEYLIIVAVVGVAAIGVWYAFGNAVTSKLTGQADAITAMTPGAGGSGASSEVGSAPAALTGPTGEAPAGAPASSDEEGGSAWRAGLDFGWGAARGLGDAAWDTVRGTIGAARSLGAGALWVATHPSDAAAGVAHAVTHPRETAEAAWGVARSVGSAIGNAASNAWDTALHGTAEERGELLGRAVFEVAATVGTGGAAHTTKARFLGGVVRRADDAADVSRAARHLDEATLAARRAARPSADDIRAESRRLYDRYNEDEMFDRMIASADANGGFATRDPDLAFTTVDKAALESIMERGVLPGSALGRAGPNAEKIWFGDGAPFYGEGVTLVIPKSRLEELYGGRASSGLAGQGNVITVPADRVPDGIPFDEFAVVESIGRGYVEPIHIPPGWQGGVGPRLPDPLPTE